MNTGNNNKLSKYYLGGHSDSNLDAETIYLAERGKTTSSGNALYWDGKIGLMYPSDCGYASGNYCVTHALLPHYMESNCDNWISLSNSSEWTMTPIIDSVTSVYTVSPEGVLWTDVNMRLNFRPVFYLSSDVSITSGTGTSSDPYLVSK